MRIRTPDSLFVRNPGFGLLLCALTSAAGMVFAQPTTMQAAPPASQPAAAASSAKPSKPLAVPAPASSDWKSLSAAQQAALKPLEFTWATFPANQQRKWLEVAPGFAKLSPADQAKTHSRMSAWSGMTPQQRANARLNFADASAGLSAEERKAKWQAYQALPPEERQRQRAEGKVEQPKSMALAQKPAAADRLAVVPRRGAASVDAPMLAASGAASGKKQAKIAISPTAVTTP